MFQVSKIHGVVVLGAAFTLWACKKDEEKAKASAPTKQVTNPTNPVTKAPAKTPAIADATYVSDLMKPYEVCRALLAADKGAGVADCAKKLSAAANAVGKAPAAAKPHLAELGKAADALANTPADDLATLRLAFGSVSKTVVALLAASPAAAKDYRVFECPMAKGYKRWAQHDKNMANPYMGKAMLACGTEVHDHHGGMSGAGNMKH